MKAFLTNCGPNFFSGNSFLGVILGADHEYDIIFPIRGIYTKMM